MNIQTLTLGPLATNCYLVRAEESRCAVIIDPAANSKRLLAALEEQGLTLEAILLTHAHFDHIGALKNLRAATNARVYIGEADKDDPSRMCHDLLTYTDTYQDGDFVTAGGLRFQVLATPGHTPGSVCLLCENVLFSGDTLFAGSYGRTDFLGGSVLVVSQFTLYGDVSHGRRPSFIGAAKPELAIPLYELFLAECERLGFPPQHGEFGAYMQVASENDGPVTLIVDTDDLR